MTLFRVSIIDVGMIDWEHVCPSTARVLSIYHAYVVVMSKANLLLGLCRLEEVPSAGAAFQNGNSRVQYLAIIMPFLPHLPTEAQEVLYELKNPSNILVPVLDALPGRKMYASCSHLTKQLRNS
jgi:hypothetical protein